MNNDLKKGFEIVNRSSKFRKNN